MTIIAQQALLQILQTCFEQHLQRQPGLHWEQVISRQKAQDGCKANKPTGC